MNVSLNILDHENFFPKEILIDFFQDNSVSRNIVWTWPSGSSKSEWELLSVCDRTMCRSDQEFYKKVWSGFILNVIYYANHIFEREAYWSILLSIFFEIKKTNKTHTMLAILVTNVMHGIKMSIYFILIPKVQLRSKHLGEDISRLDY